MSEIKKLSADVTAFMLNYIEENKGSTDTKAQIYIDALSAAVDHFGVEDEQLKNILTPDMKAQMLGCLREANIIRTNDSTRRLF